jgi:hypothetical protein
VGVLVRLLAFALLARLPAAAQLADTNTYTYGNRPIDQLPKSHYAQPEDQRDWTEPGPPAEHELKVHPKDLFRIGDEGIERLCVIEAQRPEPKSEGAGYRLSLVERPGGTLWETWPDWLGTNQRMRPYWLPVGAGGRQYVELAGPGGMGGMPLAASAEVDLTQDAPWALVEAVPTERVTAIDAGYGLLGRAERVAVGGGRLRFRVALRPGHPCRDGVAVTVWLGGLSQRMLRAEDRTIAATDRPALETFEVDASPVFVTERADPRNNILGVSVDVRCGREQLAHGGATVYLTRRAPKATFGARYADLRYTLDVKDGDARRSWHELWGNSDKRDVVVSFPDTDARFVFWRGASYVGCWAFPEAWLCYEWLEAEPYFYGAVDCVEPIQDRDCKYSQAEIVSSTPARAVVRWKYALTDFEDKIIRDEHAEETFTFYPDGSGTRYLRGFYTSGWHETQEFIVINRPGRWPSQALSPQAITFLSPSGERQAPVWPKPGFSLSGWPQVIAVVNVGNGPYPYMVTPDAPSQVKVWADPYLDKPDLFNSYPHWPVTRGMLTSWLSDPADFARPTHSNLANLVSDPIRETADEKDFVWLIGVSASEQQTLHAARCWLKPGRIDPIEGVASAEYSQIERAYVVHPTPNAQTCRFSLIPEDDTPIINPAFLIEGWTGPAEVAVNGARRVLTGQEGERLVVWAEGRFSGQAEVEVR